MSIGPMAVRAGLGPFSPFLTLLRHGRLILELTRRDVSGRYRGSIGGLFWSFINPLLMLAIYSFVFGYIFRSRWPLVDGGEVHFSIVLFVGLIISNLFSECLNRAPGLVVSNPNYVKKVIFPLEVLPWVTVASALFHAAISILALLLVMWLSSTPIAWTAVALPFLLMLLVPMALGLTWLLAALGVYFRDTQQVVGILTLALVFLSPIFYARESLPQEYRWLLSLNPLTFVVESARGLVLWGHWPDPAATAGYVGAALCVAWLGFVSFQATRKGFADVL